MIHTALWPAAGLTFGPSVWCIDVETEGLGEYGEGCCSDARDHSASCEGGELVNTWQRSVGVQVGSSGAERII
eukprot:4033269-Pleurochrysis_carterae.AAC.2